MKYLPILLVCVLSGCRETHTTQPLFKSGDRIINSVSHEKGMVTSLTWDEAPPYEYYIFTEKGERVRWEEILIEEYSEYPTVRRGFEMLEQERVNAN